MDGPEPHVRIPVIPDHEMLRVIGRGAYGEIWMARSVTGALRAVKVVYRTTFESERAFNREFSGMSAFEPISRAHDGFVDILHVGRNESGKFFYYVMELADDQASGADIDVTNYEPKTLKAESGRALPVSECVRIGRSLAEALMALHKSDLAHRDIKPSNIIFVNGAPKLADIGLVAASGQQSFVGTEGYVPPEGPGTAQADIYSLGKVLYEISMGKDRLDFPEVNSDLHERSDKDALLQLNGILLKACAHSPGKRYRDAEELRDELLKLENGHATTRSRVGPIALALALLGLVVVVAFFGIQHFRATKKAGVAATFASASIATEPAGAMIVLDDAVQQSPAMFRDVAAGKHSLRIMLPEFDPVETSLQLSAGQALTLPPFQLQRSKGSLQLNASLPNADFELTKKGETPRRGHLPALLHGLPTGVYDVTAKRADWELHDRVEIKRGEVTIKSFDFANGSVKIISAPPGAVVSQNGKEIGNTPLLIDNVRPGDVDYKLQLAGFKESALHGDVHPNQQTFLAARLERKFSAQAGGIWENSLGMRFVQAGDVRLSVWETRVRDWAAFCDATRRTVDKPDFAQTQNDPVVKVNWQDAIDFCQWLTEKERRENLIDESQSYRLPTDREWSVAAGLPNESGATPEERDGGIKGEYPWGRQWPPPAGAGNYADQSSRLPAAGKIPGYTDGFANTSPVGSFKANSLGIYDLGGNVWEWCADLYKPGSRWGVLRGGSWANGNRAELLTSYRNVVDRNERDVIFGFRCVLAADDGK